MANNSLSRDQERVRRHCSAVITLALQKAKRAIEFELRAKGLKVAHYSCRELRLMAEQYFNQHRAELIANAEEVIATSPYFARWRLPVANINSDAQTPKQPNSMGSVVQNLGSEWRTGQ
jgi:hypothetical protein